MKWQVRNNNGRYEVYYLKPDGILRGGVKYLTVVYEDFDNFEDARKTAAAMNRAVDCAWREAEL